MQRNNIYFSYLNRAPLRKKSDDEEDDTFENLRQLHVQAVAANKQKDKAQKADQALAAQVTTKLAQPLSTFEQAVQAASETLPTNQLKHARKLQNQVKAVLDVAQLVTADPVSNSMSSVEMSKSADIAKLILSMVKTSQLLAQLVTVNAA